MAQASKGSVSVLVADANQMSCQLLTSALKRCRHRFNVVGSVVSSDEALKLLRAREPDVALISAGLQDGALMGFRVLRELRSTPTKTRVITLLDAPDPSLIINSFRGGAKGVFCRSDPVATLCKCIYTVHQGQIWADSRELELILQELAQTAPLRVVDSKGAPILTKREEAIVSLVAEGLTNREISRELNLSEHTVKNYLFRVFDKLGVSNRSELIVYTLSQRRVAQIERS